MNRPIKQLPSAKDGGAHTTMAIPTAQAAIPYPTPK